MSYRAFRSGLAGLALALGLSCSGVAEAMPYTNVYVFGDSLSDSGNVLNITSSQLPVPSYYTDGTNTGRVTNGLNYIDRVASYFGITLTPSTAGGTNYAYAGARSDYMRPELVPYGGLSFEQQVNQYLGSVGGVVDPDALYVLWIGANDVSDALGNFLAGALSGSPDSTIIPAAISHAITSIITEYVTLQTLGATHFVIGNVPDLGLTPTLRDLAAMFGNPAIAAAGTQASQAFNNALSSTVVNYTFPTTDLTMFDAYGLLHELTDNPTAYGLTNTSSACYDGEVDGTAKAGVGGPHLCATPSQYLYFDSEHPSAVAHLVGANILYTQLVPEPSELALCFTALGLLGGLRLRRSRA